MKQFAFPFSVLCANDEEYKDAFSILQELGYNLDKLCGDNHYSQSHPFISTCFKGVINNFGVDCGAFNYDHPRHHITTFDPALVRDIAAVCTNETWQFDEPIFSIGLNVVKSNDNSMPRNNHIASGRAFRRPTLAEICAHHGYEIKGRDIVKIEAKQEEPKPIVNEYARIAKLINVNGHRLHRIKELETENARLASQHETFARNVDTVIERLEAENEQLKAKLKEIERIAK